VRSFLQELQAHVSFTLSSKCIALTSQENPLTQLYRKEITGLCTHLVLNACSVGTAGCNLWGRHLSFSLVMYLAYSMATHQVNNIGNNDADRHDTYCSGNQKKNPLLQVKKCR